MNFNIYDSVFSSYPQFKLLNTSFFENYEGINFSIVHIPTQDHFILTFTNLSNYTADINPLICRYLDDKLVEIRDKKLKQIIK